MPDRVCAIRGATTIEHDTAKEVFATTVEVVSAMLERNDVASDDLISIVFTTTGDITSAFPATAARSLGLSDVPLLGALENTVPGALPLCIRVMAHCYSDRSRAEIHHVYLHGATTLRSDLVD